MILGAIILGNALDECGLLRRIALKCISKCGGTCNGTLYGIYLVGVVAAFLTFTQAYMVMITLTFGICRAMNLEKTLQSALECFCGMIGAVTPCTFMYNPTYLALGDAGIRIVVSDFTSQWWDIIFITDCIFSFSWE